MPAVATKGARRSLGEPIARLYALFVLLEGKLHRSRNADGICSVPVKLTRSNWVVGSAVFDRRSIAVLQAEAGR